MKKKFLLTAGIVILLVLLGLGYYGLRQNEPVNVTVSQAGSSSPDWRWENPFTFRSISIPSGWQQANNEALESTVLALSHATGRSLVYLTYEEAIEAMTLEEYVDVMRTANNEELGTEEFSAVQDNQGREVFVSSGARYFSDNLVVTNIRIWSDQPNHFWRSVSITDAEYRDLEYRAVELLEQLASSTAPD